MGQNENFREIFISMARRFTSVYYIDLENDTYYAPSQSEAVARAHKNRGKYWELINTLSETLIHPRDRLLYLEMLEPAAMKKRLMEQGAQEFEYRIKKLNGAYHWMRNEAVPAKVDGQGRISMVTLFTTDIHAQKMKEDKDRSILRIALENTSGDFFEYDPARERLDFLTMGRSKVPVEITLKELEEGKRISGVRFDRIQDFRKGIEDLMACGEKKTMELSGRSVNGDEVWIRVILNCVRGEDGEVNAVVGVTEDITPLKEIERAYSLEEQYRKTVQKRSLATYVINFTKEIFIGCERNGDAAVFVKAGQKYEQLLRQGVEKEIAERWRREFCRRFSVAHVTEEYRSGRNQIEMDFELEREFGKIVWMRADLRLLMDERRGELIGYLHFLNIDEEKRREQELLYIAEHDSLTGLYTKNVMEQKIRALLENQSTGGTLLMIDLDDFKGINDSCGHPEGDRVLRLTAGILKRQFRQQDIIGRAGGDEFSVFISGPIDRSQLERRLRLVCEECGKIMPPTAGKPGSTCSIGAACSVDGGKTFEELYQEADAALYRRKAAGGNGFTIFGA